MDSGEEVQTAGHNCVYIILFVLHVSAFLYSRHQAIQKTNKERRSSCLSCFVFLYFLKDVMRMQRKFLKVSGLPGKKKEN